MNIETLKKAAGVQVKRRTPSMYQLEVSVPKDYEEKLDTLEIALDERILELRRLIQEAREESKSLLEQRIARTSGTLSENIREVIESVGGLDNRVKEELQKLHEKVTSISWHGDLQKTASELRRYTDRVEKSIKDIIVNLPKQKDYRNDIDGIRKGLVSREEAEQEVKKTLEMLGSDFRKIQKNVAEMGYSLQLFADGTLVGTTPSLNLVGGNNVTLAHQFVNGIPKITINSSGGVGTVYTETLTDSGDHQNFTALHTITTIFTLATLNGQYISSGKYTKSGDTITLSSPDANIAASGLELVYA